MEKSAIVTGASPGDRQGRREATGEGWVRSRSQLCQQHRGGRRSSGRNQEKQRRGDRD